MVVKGWCYCKGHQCGIFQCTLTPPKDWGLIVIISIIILTMIAKIIIAVIIFTIIAIFILAIIIIMNHRPHRPCRARRLAIIKIIPLLPSSLSPLIIILITSLAYFFKIACRAIFMVGVNSFPAVLKSTWDFHIGIDFWCLGPVVHTPFQTNW